MKLKIILPVLPCGFCCRVVEAMIATQPLLSNGAEEPAAWWFTSSPFPALYLLALVLGALLACLCWRLRQREKEAQARLRQMTRRHEICLQRVGCMKRMLQFIDQHHQTLPDLLQAIADEVPSGMQFPERTACRIQLEEEYRSPNFIDASGRIRTEFKYSEGRVGRIEAVCLSGEGAEFFLPEEGEFLEILAKRLESMLSRKQVIEQLRESEEKYRKLFELESDALFLIENSTGKIIEVNSAACRIYGYSREELLRMDHTMVSAEPEQTRDATLKHQPRVPIRYHKKKDGTVFQVEITATHLEWKGKESHIAAIRDISDRIQAQKNLEQQRRFLNHVIDAIPSCIYVTDATGKVILVNSHFIQYMASNRLSALNGSIREIIEDREIAGKLYEGDRAILAGKERRIETEEIRKTGNGGKQWLYIVKQAMTDEAGSCTGLLSVMVDITQLKNLEMQLLHSQKMESVARLTGGIAHDFNNILMAINGYTELMLRKLSPDNRLRSYAEQVMTAGERAAALTQQLLAFSRKQIIQPKVIDLNQRLLEIERMLHRFLGEDIEYITLPDPNLRRIRIDPGQVEQIIINLVLNARDAMPQGGKLMLETRNVEFEHRSAGWGDEVEAGTYAMLLIKDTGCGMEPEVLAQIFEPFFTTKEQGKGTGLGLSSVYGIVKQNHGFIQVESEPGAGTTFRLYFPGLETEEAREETKPLRLERARDSETVLVVEDEKVVRSYLVQILEEAGYRILEASNGSDALDYLPEPTLGLVVTDVVMPKMGGLEMAERMRRLRPELKVLFISGYTEDAIMRQGWIQERREFLQKPVAPDLLLRKVREMLDRAGGGG